MPFETGKPKTGGRQPGKPNKATADIKSRVSTLIDEQFDTIVSTMQELEPKDQVTAYLKFMEYVLPKQRKQKIDVTGRLDSMTDEQLNSLIDHILANP